MKINNIILAVMVLVFISMLIIYPQITFDGATKGMETWLTIVFPSLLPFFIVAEIMISLGVVDFLSALLSPIMRRLFGCSGVSSFVWVMSATSGYPTSARIVSSLLKQKKIPSQEGQKILSFSSTSGPLFMIGAVGIGMLNSPNAGKIIAISHYISAIIIGLIFRSYGQHPRYTKQPRTRQSSVLHKAINSFIRAREDDGRTLGRMLGDSIKSAFETLTMIGGFLILFSVLIHLILNFRLIKLLDNSPLIQGILAGMLEMTTGSMLVCKSSVPISTKIAGICFIIGWSGVSIHFQVFSLLAGRGIRVWLYLMMKLLHGALSAIIGWFIATIIYIGDITVANIPKPRATLSINFISHYSSKILIIAIVSWALVGLISGLAQTNIKAKK
ncbi:MAG: sporulation integral membrane protein YlbJ [Clostridiales bacterium]|nr:sporulation integral membrane protein YlbJ [Clostridiales bacterium]